MSTLIQSRCGDLKHTHHPLTRFSLLASVGTHQHTFYLIEISRVKHDLTNKLGCSKNVLELISRFNLMSDPKIDQLDPGVGDVLVQQHDILRLKDTEKDKG